MRDPVTTPTVDPETTSVVVGARRFAYQILPRGDGLFCVDGVRVSAAVFHAALAASQALESSAKRARR